MMGPVDPEHSTLAPFSSLLAITCSSVVMLLIGTARNYMNLQNGNQDHCQM